jgi:hypothetical protein
VAELTGNEPDLTVGDGGEGVVLLQVRLYGLGIYREVPDGTFNMYTENAVRELQSMLGQDNDGMVTTQTWEAILYLEQQYGIQYQYTSPYDALGQIVYDRDHPETGPDQWDAGQYGYAQDDYAQQGYAGQLSADGQWQWDGTDWQPAPSATGSDTSTEYAAYNVSEGQLSDDGQWRWDGTSWQPAGGDSYVGQLSEDGQWRWDGNQWHAA